MKKNSSILVTLLLLLCVLSACNAETTQTEKQSSSAIVSGSGVTGGNINIEGAIAPVEDADGNKSITLPEGLSLSKGATTPNSVTNNSNSDNLSNEPTESTEPIEEKESEPFRLVFDVTKAAQSIIFEFAPDDYKEGDPIDLMQYQLTASQVVECAQVIANALYDIGEECDKSVLEFKPKYCFELMDNQGEEMCAILADEQLEECYYVFGFEHPFEMNDLGVKNYIHNLITDYKINKARAASDNTLEDSSLNTKPKNKISED